MSENNHNFAKLRGGFCGDLIANLNYPRIYDNENETNRIFIIRYSDIFIFVSVLI